jgi:tripartite ATP-independent transporter DctP family solute receptor
MLTSGCIVKSNTKTLKLAHGLDVKHSVHIAMVSMANRVKELSGGKMTIEIYPGGQLGSERECLELLQLGSLDITKVSAAGMEGFVEEYKALGMPYIFRDKEHCYRVLDGPIGKEILKKGEKYWLRGLCFYDAGARSFYTSKPIQKPEDLAGLKIRVMLSITAVNMVREFGASPTPITWGELYTALQGGVVDGAENNPPSFYLSHHYEVCKYYTLDEHTIIPDVVVISTNAWEKLNDQEREWLQQAIDESIPIQRKLWKASEEEALAEVKKAGVEVIIPDKGLFKEKAESVYDLFKDQPNVYNVMTQIQEAQ